jgi:uncharacterized membrane protein YjjP (DUF1212 family)
MKDPEKNFQILEFGNYWMDISRTIYQLFFIGLSRRSYSRTIKNTFLLSGIAALVLGLFSFIFKTPPTIVSNENQELVDYFVL